MPRIVTTSRASARGDTAWGYLAAPDGPPLQLIHRDCGEIADAHLACSVCGEAIDAGNVKSVPGPGAVEPLVGSAWRADAKSTSGRPARPDPAL